VSADKKKETPKQQPKAKAPDTLGKTKKQDNDLNEKERAVSIHEEACSGQLFGWLV
jgi:hypothetical protein